MDPLIHLDHTWSPLDRVYHLKQTINIPTKHPRKPAAILRAARRSFTPPMALKERSIYSDLKAIMPTDDELEQIATHAGISTEQAQDFLRRYFDHVHIYGVTHDALTAARQTAAETAGLSFASVTALTRAALRGVSLAAARGLDTEEAAA